MMDDLIVFGANNDPDELRFHLDPEFIVWMETTFFQGKHCKVANERVQKIGSDGTEFKNIDKSWSCFIVHVHAVHVTIQIIDYLV